MSMLPSSGPHLHILLVHIPILGFIVTTIWLFLAMRKNNVCHQKGTWVSMFILFALAIPTYISGAASRWSIQSRADLDIDVGLIFLHQNVALITIALAGWAAMLSWFALWMYQRRETTCNRLNWAILIFGALTSWFAVQAGSIGGRINHPEVRTGIYESVVPENIAVAGNPGGIVDWSFNLILGGDQYWRWPAFEAIHFLGMALIFGVVLIIALRVLGLAKDQLSFSSVHRLLPVGMLGLCINLDTGFLFFIADSGRYVSMPGFPYKIGAIVVAMIVGLYFTLNKDLWNLREGDDASTEAKAVAVIFIVAWATVIFFGRQLPYIFGGG
jgi:uncharacterized membrane protein